MNREKKEFQKKIVCVSPISSVIFWFPCTHELEHIQILMFSFSYGFYFEMSILCDLFIIGMYAFFGTLFSARSLQRLSHVHTAASNRIWLYRCNCDAIPFFSPSSVSFFIDSLYLYAFTSLSVRTTIHVKILNCFFSFSL